MSKICRDGIAVITFMNYFKVKCRVVVNVSSGFTCDHLPKAML